MSSSEHSPETRPGEDDPSGTVSGRALVTGGAVRVGRSVALALARAGWDVAVHYHRSGPEADGVAETIRGEGRTAVTVEADLRRVDRVAPMVRRAADGLGGLDLLVNNAAAFPRARPREVTPEEWDEVFALNARAPFFCAVEARRRMGDAGSVVNVADVAAFEAWPTHAPYAATKAALVSLTRSLAAAWAPEVRVNAVAPGPVLLPEEADARERGRAAASTALGRTGSPEDVARAVLYLARAGFVTGEVLRVDGGEGVARHARSAPCDEG